MKINKNSKKFYFRKKFPRKTLNMVIIKKYRLKIYPFKNFTREEILNIWGLT